MEKLKVSLWGFVYVRGHDIRVFCVSRELLGDERLYTRKPQAMTTEGRAHEVLRYHDPGG